MVHIIKVYFEDGKNPKQIRRLAVNSEIVGKFDLLVRKIREIFPLLANRKFDVTWKDSENDIIHMSSDDELAQAVANADEDLLRIYVFTSDVQQPTIPKTPNTNKPLETHPGVVCDSCEEIINGHRYKCLQCRNYDLCSSCNAANNHADHDMIKLVRPSYVRRDWVFIGARKLYRSMFGGSLPSFAQTDSKEKPTDPRRSSINDLPQFHNLFNDLIAPAEKILKGNLDTLMNFYDTVTVKTEGCPFKANSSEAEPKMDESHEKNTKEKSFSEVKAFPLAEEVIVVKDVESAAEKKAPEDVIIQTNSEVVQEASSSSNGITSSASTSSVADQKHNKMLGESEQKFPTPYEMFCDAEKSANADGWTFVLDHEAQENSTCNPTTEISGAEPKKEAIYPNISETLHSDETPKGLFGATPEVAKPTDAVVTTQDPEILNSLKRMQAMGFTNEGGWLERLLITKNGSINDALDALYPNVRRR